MGLILVKITNIKSSLKYTKKSLFFTLKNGTEKPLFLLTLRVRCDIIIKVFKSIRDVGKMGYRI